ncbi:MAG: hypothetical protein OEZ01_09825, partial [Candidatus Heimdallarchaeota archaeon]|nr:hypothetical protein [Candidatus Heimdallarchaeota archaeon]
MISNKLIRQMQRLIHLSSSIILGIFIYTDIFVSSTSQLIIKFVIIPMIVISGIGMWLLPKLKRKLKYKT